MLVDDEVMMLVVRYGVEEATALEELDLTMDG